MLVGIHTDSCSPLSKDNEQPSQHDQVVWALAVVAHQLVVFAVVFVETSVAVVVMVMVAVVFVETFVAVVVMVAVVFVESFVAVVVVVAVVSVEISVVVVAAAAATLTIPLGAWPLALPVVATIMPIVVAAVAFYSFSLHS